MDGEKNMVDEREYDTAKRSRNGAFRNVKTMSINNDTFGNLITEDSGVNKYIFSQTY
jgi:hypothetical protein